ncbi:MAG: acetylxylan esterase, partial [Nonomuraea sp.]|nr:acetylxylan esterase [Nonomuraea sp.]
AGPKRLFPLTAGHMPYPGEAEEHARLSAERALFLA